MRFQRFRFGFEFRRTIIPTTLQRVQYSIPCESPNQNPLHYRFCKKMFCTDTEALRDGPKFTDLPDAAMTRIVKHALGLPEEGTLNPDRQALQSAVILARTSLKLRRATANSIHSLKFPHEEGLWPSVAVLSPHAWLGLHTVDCVVNRSSLLGFLKWGMPASDITHLRLRVVGEPYPEERLGKLERMLLSRMLTQMGLNLVELDISGIDCQGVMFACLFQCTKLRKLSIGAYGNGKPSTLLSMMILLCLVNRDHLEVVKFPFTEWAAEMESVPDGQHLYASCNIAWQTLFGSYKAGMKESAVNLPSKEEELVASFQKMQVRMDSLELSMNKCLEEFETISQYVSSSEVPNQILFDVLPRIRTVNSESRGVKE